MRLVLVAACAATALAFGVHRLRTDGAVQRSMATAAPAPSPANAGDMLVRLPDGSMARGAQSADVRVESLRPDRAELVQTAGTVRYDVTPDARRKFEVRVRDIRVSVLGTAFQVEMAALSVAVRVERGSVEVVQHDRRVVLAAGEGITFDTTGSGEARASERADEAGVATAPAVDPVPDQPQASLASPVAATAQLLERADRARARGDLDGAARVLRELIQRHPSDKRVALAEFMMGRIRGAQGAHHEAAQAFAACLAREPSGSLGEDALAELARAHARAGETNLAVAAARRYLSRYPAGVHQRAMSELASGAN